MKGAGHRFTILRLAQLRVELAGRACHPEPATPGAMPPIIVSSIELPSRDLVRDEMLVV
jgi:hypothetical protein